MCWQQKRFWLLCCRRLGMPPAGLAAGRRLGLPLAGPAATAAHLVDMLQPLMADLAYVQQANGAADVDKRAVGPHALHHARHHVANLRGIVSSYLVDGRGASPRLLPDRRCA